MDSIARGCFISCFIRIFHHQNIFSLCSTISPGFYKLEQSRLFGEEDFLSFFLQITRRDTKRCEKRKNKVAFVSESEA